MKLRLKKNSIRLRLQISEITQLRESGYVEEEIKFSPTQTFTYSIHIKENENQVSSGFLNNSVKINIPNQIAKPWLETDQVSIEHSQVVNEGLSLNILLEKDFQCLSPRENETDMYPNPEA